MLWKQKRLQNQINQQEFPMPKVQIIIPKNGETFTIDQDTRPTIRYYKYSCTYVAFSKRVWHNIKAVPLPCEQKSKQGMIRPMNWTIVCGSTFYLVPYPLDIILLVKFVSNIVCSLSKNLTVPSLIFDYKWLLNMYYLKWGNF